MPIRYFITDRGTTGVTSTQLQQAVQSAFSHVGGCHDGTDLIAVCRVHARRPDIGRRRHGDRLSEPPGSRSHARRDLVHDRYDHRRDCRVRHLLQHGASRGRCLRRGERPALFDLQSIALHEIGHLHGLAHSAMGETELRAGGRRVIAAEAVMFPIAFCLRHDPRAHVQGRRHRRHRRHLFLGELLAGHRKHQRQGDQEREGGARRACRRVRHANATRWSAASR